MRTILIVEDELSIAYVLTSMLQEEGYTVAVTANGQEALLWLEQERPELIISDMMMPVMGGAELCNRLNADPAHSSIPLIMMSSIAKVADLNGCSYAAFIKKPFAIDVLLETVSNLLG